jgi:hypothetical protein
MGIPTMESQSHHLMQYLVKTWLCHSHEAMQGATAYKRIWVLPDELSRQYSWRASATKLRQSWGGPKRSRSIVNTDDAFPCTFFVTPTSASAFW